MKRIHTLLVIAGFIFANEINAQQPSRFLVKFKNKGGNTFSLSDPSAYLSQRSIERRTRYSITYDSTDLPITKRYLDSLTAIPTVSILSRSKWLNQVAIRISDTSAANIAYVQNRINNMPFVQSYMAISKRAGLQKEPLPADPASQRTMQINADVYNYGPSGNQIKIHNGDFLHNIGLRGNDMVIGILDGGFKNYLTVKAFDSVRANGQILGIWDFVANDSSVNEDHQHGMQCFSIIAGNVPGQLVGTAPKSKFYLYRTEDTNSETPIEEHNWVAGVERADSAGGDVISSSLGYLDFDAPFTDHTYAEFNGNTTMPAIGADLAAKKGIIVVNAAGNYGPGKIVTPADADSILAVGAVNAAGVPAGFSSRGPSSDGQVKPDVASMGVATIMQFSDNTIGPGNGTSFACPNLAGLVTALWQGFQEFNNMKIMDAVRKAGSRANNPNDTIGYGIPDMKKAMLGLLHQYSTANATVSNCRTTITWNSKDVSAMKYEIERRSGTQPFVKVGERFGTGNSFAAHNYTFSDSLSNSPAGTLNYRIRQIIDTSVSGFSSGYIDTITLNLAASCISTAIPGMNRTEAIVVLQPNPSFGKLRISITTPGAVKNLEIRIADASGRVIGNYRRSKGSGTETFPISVSHLAKGKYYVSVYDSKGLMITKELIKL